MPVESVRDAIKKVRTLLALPAGDEGTAFRVRRLDLPGLAYFLVHTAEHLACIDEATETLMMSAVAGKTSVTLSQDDAIARAQLSPGAQVELVWVPSQATQSMLDPVWAVSHSDRVVYVDQRGKRWEQLVPKGPGG